MALTIWTQPSGYNFGTFPEAVSLTLNLPLPVLVPSNITFTVISGALPAGLRLSGTTITGSPDIIANNKISSFCIRASNGTDISDRTYTMSITATNVPTFITPAGEISFGKQLYALDQTYVTYQLEAFDLGTAAGQVLTYTILSGDGELPPGLSLSTSGLISGVISPVLRVSASNGSGTYDETYFDAVAYDFASVPSSGFDSFIYDNVFYDYSAAISKPTSLSRNFQFTVTLSDGNLVAKRTFRIFVTGDDTFRADSTILDGIAGTFSADATHIRQPAFKTASNLGTYRANNYITIPIEQYDPSGVLLRLESTNEEIFANTYQVALTDNVIYNNKVTIINATGTPQIGQYLTFDNFYSLADGTVYQIQSVASLGNSKYRLTLTTNLTVTLPDGIGFYIGSLSVLPTGLSFDVNTGEIYGTSPYQPAITKTYKFTITGTRFSTNTADSVSSSRTFSVSLIGEIDSVITFITGSSLGTIPAEYNSTLKVQATTTVIGAEIVYTLVGGRLPPGLTLSTDGEIIGKVNQYYSSSLGAGLITFNGGTTTFDGSTTTFDRAYKFTVQAQDQYGYSALTKTFTVNISTPNTHSYSNIRVQPYLKASQRTSWKSFISDSSIFTASSVYRPNDTAFGLQSNLSMIVYAGIQTELAAAYVGAMGLNHKRKRFTFGNIKTAVAVDPITEATIYEVVYVEMHDPLEPNGRHLPQELLLSKLGLSSTVISADESTSIWSTTLSDLSANAPSNTRPDPLVTVDSTGYQVSNPKTGNYYPNSITNWQQRLASVGDTERNYLPLWMRSIQPGTKSELGYTLAVPLCYCQAGTSATIALNIKHSGFDFKTIDYTIDRYIIDSVTGQTSDKYLVFRNDRITV
jgi:hypothetical protein